MIEHETLKRRRQVSNISVDTIYDYKKNLAKCDKSQIETQRNGIEKIMSSLCRFNEAVLHSAE